MFKVYQKYVIKNFIIKFINLSLIFLSLVIILNILEEISFFKNIEVNFIFPIFLNNFKCSYDFFEYFLLYFYYLHNFYFTIFSEKMS